MNKGILLGAVILLILLSAVTGFGAGFLVGRPDIASLLPITGAAATTPTPNQSLNIDLIRQAYDIIQNNYADRQTLQDTNMTYAAISGMVDALGDVGHSRFLTPKMVQQEQRAISGEFEGIGALLRMKDGQPTILTPMDNSPAQKAGLRPGDIILKVNGEDMTGKSLSDIVDRVTGPAGTQVQITVQHPDTGKTETVTITRAKINVQNVTWQMLPGTKIAHIRIASFSQDVGKDLQNVIQQAKQQGAQGIILDLRNNPGGLLSEAVNVASQFIKSGDVLLEKNAQGKIDKIPVNGKGGAYDIPMVTLINEGSASAAEIVAGALQDHNRSTLIGATTFGTGTVLLNFPLQDGSALLLATQLWLTPNGRVIWHQGIKPDIEIPLPTDVAPSIPQTERNLTAQELNKLDDTQLLMGIQTLQQKMQTVSK